MTSQPTRASAPRAAAWVVGAALVLPPAGTDSRERDFCAAWLPLAAPAKEDVLVRDEARGSESDGTRACRARLRAALRTTLDAECRNWERLMDFEVRALVDRVIAPCRTDE